MLGVFRSGTRHSCGLVWFDLLAARKGGRGFTSKALTRPPRGGIAIACMLFGQLYVNSPFVGHLYVSFFFAVGYTCGAGLLSSSSCLQLHLQIAVLHFNI